MASPAKCVPHVSSDAKVTVSFATWGAGLIFGSKKSTLNELKSQIPGVACDVGSDSSCQSVEHQLSTVKMTGAPANVKRFAHEAAKRGGIAFPVSHLPEHPERSVEILVRNLFTRLSGVHRAEFVQDEYFLGMNIKLDRSADPNDVENIMQEARRNIAVAVATRIRSAHIAVIDAEVSKKFGKLFVEADQVESDLYDVAFLAFVDKPPHEGSKMLQHAVNKAELPQMLTADPHILSGYEDRWWQVLSLIDRARDRTEPTRTAVSRDTDALPVHKSVLVDALSLFSLAARLFEPPAAFKAFDGFRAVKNPCQNGFSSPHDLVPIMVELLRHMQTQRHADQPDPDCSVELLWLPMPKKSLAFMTVEWLLQVMNTDSTLQGMKVLRCDHYNTTHELLRTLASRSVVLAAPDEQLTVYYLQRYCVPVFDINSLTSTVPLRAVVIDAPSDQYLTMVKDADAKAAFENFFRVDASTTEVSHDEPAGRGSRGQKIAHSAPSGSLCLKDIIGRGSRGQKIAHSAPSGPLCLKDIMQAQAQLLDAQLWSSEPPTCETLLAGLEAKKRFDAVCKTLALKPVSITGSTFNESLSTLSIPWEVAVKFALIPQASQNEVIRRLKQSAPRPAIDAAAGAIRPDSTSISAPAIEGTPEVNNIACVNDFLELSHRATIFRTGLSSAVQCDCENATSATATETVLRLQHPTCPPEEGFQVAPEVDKHESLVRKLADYGHRFPPSVRKMLSQQFDPKATDFDGHDVDQVARQAVALLREATDAKSNVFSWQSHADIERHTNWTSKYGDDYLDPWQHRVRCISEQGGSALVCAPTSAGKTWLSCRIMKERLSKFPDEVIVYICPTKALANQVYADLSDDSEVNAAGLGIFTRDHQSNTHAARILVAVPAIISILVLNDAKSSFNNRIGMFIFDEVHCICQEATAAIVERLFCMLPCPFLAFSATFAGRDRFLTWVNQLPRGSGQGCVKLVTSDARPTEQYWETSSHQPLHPWRLFHQYECGDLEFAPDLPLNLVIGTARIFVEAGLVNDESSSAIVDSSDIDDELDNFLSRLVAHELNEARSAAIDFAGASDKDLVRNQPHFVTRLTWKRVDFRLRQLVATRHRNPLAVPKLATFYCRLQQCFPGNWDFDADIDCSTRKRSPIKRVFAIVDSSKLPMIFFRSSREDVEKLAFELNQLMTETQAAIACPCGERGCTERERTAGELRRMPRLPAHMANLDVMCKAIEAGIGVHHANLPHEFKRCVEGLLARGHLGVVFATASLAMGVHTPARTVVISADVGRKSGDFLSGTDVVQMAGRAGRRGQHDDGVVIPLGFSRASLSQLFKFSMPDLRGTVAADPSFVYKALCFVAQTTGVEHTERNKIVRTVLLDNRSARCAGPNVGEVHAVEMCRMGLDLLIAAQGATFGADGLKFSFASLVIPRFDYREPRNFLLCLLLEKRAISTKNPLVTLAVLQRVLGFDDALRAIRLRDDEPSVENWSEIESTIDRFYSSIDCCARRSLRRQVGWNDWRSRLSVALDCGVHKLPPTVMTAAFCDKDAILADQVMKLATADRNASNGVSLSLAWIGNPRLTIVEMKLLASGRPWSDIWKSFESERDELKRFGDALGEMRRATSMHPDLDIRASEHIRELEVAVGEMKSRVNTFRVDVNTPSLDAWTANRTKNPPLSKPTNTTALEAWEQLLQTITNIDLYEENLFRGYIESIDGRLHYSIIHGVTCRIYRYLLWARPMVQPSCPVSRVTRPVAIFLSQGETSNYASGMIPGWEPLKPAFNWLRIVRDVRELSGLGWPVALVPAEQGFDADRFFLETFIADVLGQLRLKEDSFVLFPVFVVAASNISAVKIAVKFAAHIVLRGVQTQELSETTQSVPVSYVEERDERMVVRKLVAAAGCR